MPNQITPERRYYAGEVRLENRDGALPLILGHAAVFNQLSVNLGGFREKVRPGAFQRSLQQSDIRALLNHDPNYVFGRNRAGTLRLEEDEVGLAVEIDPPDTGWARDTQVTIKRGDITQMSFGFRTNQDAWYEDAETGGVVRELIEVELFDVSPVTFPAYPQTDLGLRSLAGHLTGIDPALATRALYRTRMGGLSDEDLQTLQRLQENGLQIANTDLGQAPGSQRSADEPGQAPDFEAMKRHLTIIELE